MESVRWDFIGQIRSSYEPSCTNEFTVFAKNGLYNEFRALLGHRGLLPRFVHIWQVHFPRIERDGSAGMYGTQKIGWLLGFFAVSLPLDCFHPYVTVF